MAGRKCVFAFHWCAFLWWINRMNRFAVQFIQRDVMPHPAFFRTNNVRPYRIVQMAGCGTPRASSPTECANDQPLRNKKSVHLMVYGISTYKVDTRSGRHETQSRRI